MLRAFLFLLTAHFPTLASSAITPEALRDLAYAGDVDGTINAWDDVMAAWDSGDLSPSDLRAAIAVYGTSHPDVIQHVDDWRDIAPDSPVVQTARAIQFYRAGWDFRGGESVSVTSPYAFEAMHRLHQESYETAWRVFRQNPTFLPASDLLLKLNLTTKNLSMRELRKHLRDIVAAHGSRDSIFLAARIAEPKWGGKGWEQVKTLCDDNADLVTDVEEYSAEICLVDLASWLDLSGQAVPDVGQMLDRIPPHTFTDRARVIQFLASKDYARAEDVLDYIEARFPTDIYLAEAFKAAFPVHPKSADMYLSVRNARLDASLALLAHDPYHPDSLRFIESSAIGISGTLDVREVARYQNNINARRLLASPYDSAAWSALGHPVRGGRIEPGLGLEYDDYLINAIIYSNYNRHLIGNYLGRKRMAFSRVETWIESGQLPHPGPDVLDRAYYCPVMRMWRIHKYMCQHFDQPGQCGFKDQYAEDLAPMLTAARQSMNCNFVTNADVPDLGLPPIEVDLLRFVFPLPTALPN